jgi:hypothetical protein
LCIRHRPHTPARGAARRAVTFQLLNFQLSS